MKKAHWLLAVPAVCLAAAVVWALWRCYPALQSLMRPQVMDMFRAQLHAFGPLGMAALVALQLLQVVSGFLPALPIQIAAGLTYGAVPGLLLCLCGIALGSTLVFVLVKRYGRPVAERMLSPQKRQKLAFLQDAHRLGAIVFLLYLIPALPKDVFTYLAALTPLTLKRYLVLTLTARIPTILCNTFASNALMQGAYLKAAAVFCVTAALGVLCMLASPKILALLKRL